MIEVIIYFFLAVPQFHEVGEMESNVSEIGLIVFVEHFLYIFHVLIGQILLNESHFGQLLESSVISDDVFAGSCGLLLLF